MPKRVKRVRGYRSPIREQQALATRAEIRRAAAQLFERSGYAGTTITAVAKAAGVSQETVYAAFGSKRGLLRAIFQAAATGDDDPAGLLDRPWVDALRREPDQRRRLHLMAAATADTLSRSAPLIATLRQAAAVDADLGGVAREIDARQRRDTAALVRILAEAGPLRMSMSDASDVLFAIGGGDLYRRLTHGCGWREAKAAAFIHELIAHAILHDH
jgi:AcrR family transcriptional regulator